MTQGDIVRLSGFACGGGGARGVGGVGGLLDQAKQSSHTSLLDECQISQRMEVDDIGRTDLKDYFEPIQMVAVLF